MLEKENCAAISGTIAPHKSRTREAPARLRGWCESKGGCEKISEKRATMSSSCTPPQQNKRRDARSPGWTLGLAILIHIYYDI
ncbi:hypothetical protein CDAR_273991 [Caerostris darwini]|uniref:Uncharacterized protein n=1 Tax=Caerostris darwini TaxID=1538125 RepID=A0AAV4RDM9_9ARAC|nr:hypothetical protein CDAR_273991 [Caerostris darwini]